MNYSSSLMAENMKGKNLMLVNIPQKSHILYLAVLFSKMFCFTFVNKCLILSDKLYAMKRIYFSKMTPN